MDPENVQIPHHHQQKLRRAHLHRLQLNPTHHQQLAAIKQNQQKQPTPSVNPQSQSQQHRLWVIEKGAIGG